MNNKTLRHITYRGTSCLILLFAFFLSGCESYPKAYHLDSALKAKMATDDSDEIHRRWGDFSYLVGKRWIGNGSGMTMLVSMAWVIKGASATTTFWSCEDDGCYLTERLMQYNPEEKILEVMLERDVPPSREEHRYRTVTKYTIGPDGTAYGSFLNFDWKYDRSEGVFNGGKVKFYEIGEQQYQATVAKLVAATTEVRRQKAENSRAFWNNMATGMAALSKATAQTAQDYRAQQARTDALNQSIQNSRDIAAARERERIANDQAQRSGKQQQQAAQMQAPAKTQATAGNRQAAMQAQAAQRETEARAKAAANDAEKQKRLAEQERQAQMNAQQQSRQAAAPSASSSTAAADYWAARRAGNDNPDTGGTRQDTASLGRAGAWCTKTKSGGFVCTGPLQKITMSEPTLEAALGRVGCTNGQGYSPTVGQGTYFDCGRELNSYDKKVPTYDPYYNSGK